jgi:hypothetical protein
VAEGLPCPVAHDGGGVGPLHENQQCVAPVLYFGNRAAPEPGLPVLSVDQLGGSGFDVSLQLLDLVPHGGSPLRLSLAVAGIGSDAPASLSDSASAPGRGGVKVERPQRTEDERP